jgi:hypothetical protein
MKSYCNKKVKGFYTMHKTLLTLEQIRERLQDRNLAEVAKRIDVGYATLHRIKTNPKYSCNVRTLKELSDYLSQ